jgi:hypothetical protein
MIGQVDRDAARDAARDPAEPRRRERRRPSGGATGDGGAKGDGGANAYPELPPAEEDDGLGHVDVTA